MHSFLLQVGPSILVLGDEARDCGLKVSLLERLHDIYSKERNASHLCATLLTNHRCHPALLALPSYLFYESALINSDSQDQPKLHPSTSFPLHFICSSLHTNLEVKNDTNPYEADLLLADSLRKYSLRYIWSTLENTRVKSHLGWQRFYKTSTNTQRVSCKL